MSKKRSAASLHSDASVAPAVSASASTPAEKKARAASGSPIAAKMTRTASGGSAAPSSPLNNQLLSTAHSAMTPSAYSAVAVSHATHFKAYSASTADRANQILHQVLPRKVLELDYMVSTSIETGFQQSVEFPFNEDGTFIAGRETQPIQSNPSVSALIPIVKKEVLQMIDNIGALKLMIQLRIPAVDDGNNFGVEIQEESINELSKVEDVAFQYLEKIQAYYGNRTRVAAKISKYPGILDYWQSLRELDESFHTDLRLHCIEMRNSYATIHDLLRKNEEKITNPRGDGDAEGKSRRHAFA